MSWIINAVQALITLLYTESMVGGLCRNVRAMWQGNTFHRVVLGLGILAGVLLIGGLAVDLALYFKETHTPSLIGRLRRKRRARAARRGFPA